MEGQVILKLNAVYFSMSLCLKPERHSHSRGVLSVMSSVARLDSNVCVGGDSWSIVSWGTNWENAKYSSLQ